jgi:NAD(P)-dependent dehydrogenase (short-subunit alcohol dehydrogenase family)
MVCRNEGKGSKALEEVHAVASGDKPILEIADLSGLNSVNDLADRIGNRFEKLDVLVNNVGVMLDERQESADGIEMTFATNVLGGFLLTHKLLALLRAAAPSRLIHVTSGGMYTQKLDIDDLLYLRKPYDGVEAYAQTKRAQVMLNEMWAEKLKPDAVTSNCMHPGWADTPGVERSLPRFYRLLQPILRSPAQGADTIVWLGASEEAGAYSGKLFFDRAPRRVHVMKRTVSPDGDDRKLWNFCMEKAGLS